MKDIKRNLFNPVQSIIAVIFLLNICNSCTIEKRIYNRGYYLVWHKKNNFSSSKNSKTSIEREIIEPVDYNDMSTQNNAISEVCIPKSNIFSNNELLCDTILLKNGKIISSQIINLNDTLLVYNDCPSINSNESFLDVKDVKAIKYSSGEIKMIKHQSVIEENSFFEERRKNRELKALKKAACDPEIVKKRTKFFLIIMISFPFVLVLLWGCAYLIVGLMGGI